MSAFPSIRIEGGLLASDVFERILAGDLPGQGPEDFGLEGRRSLTDEIAAAFAEARALWSVFKQRLDRTPPDDPAISLTRDVWIIPLLGVLGHELCYTSGAYEVNGLSFAISHLSVLSSSSPESSDTEDDDTFMPVHVVGARQEIGSHSPSGGSLLAPHSLVQELLNRTKHLWGIVTNGLTLRLLRDSTFAPRGAYVEFDLSGIFDEQRLSDFAVLYRLLHRTRLLPAPEYERTCRLDVCWQHYNLYPVFPLDELTCLLEQYHTLSLKEGSRARDQLRDGAHECIRILAEGFLHHPSNEDLRVRIREGKLTAVDFFGQILQLVYRLLFLLVTEERGIISSSSPCCEQPSTVRLSETIEKGSPFCGQEDLWHVLRVLWHVIGKERLASPLDLTPLSGQLFAGQYLDKCTLSSQSLLEAFRHLTMYRESSSTLSRRVSYAALDVEELGSVYESLLEFHPDIDLAVSPPRFELMPAGRGQFPTELCYTPFRLVASLIQRALEPVLADRLKAAKTAEDKEKAILSLKVCDPACGSGQFLLAAARCLGKELARIRTGEAEPAPELVREAVRDVVSHCIYGIDKNPLAVDLCRAALGIESHTVSKPLTFLDHRICCGDSLVGVFDLRALVLGIPEKAFTPLTGDDKKAAWEAKRRNAVERTAPMHQFPLAEQLRGIAERMRVLGNLEEDTVEEVRRKAEYFSSLQQCEEYRKLKLACDVWTSAFFQPFPGKSGTSLTTHVMQAALSTGRLHDSSLEAFVLGTAHSRRFFHWDLAFPEVLGGGGFDVMLGHPPFLYDLEVSRELGLKYRQWVVTMLNPSKDLADLCPAFFRRAFEAIREAGRFGFIGIHAGGCGCSRERETCIGRIIENLGRIAFYRSVRWPGTPDLDVDLIVMHKDHRKSER